MSENHLLDDGSLPDFPRALRMSTHISREEEKLLGIDEENTTAYRLRHEIPSSDGLFDVCAVEDGAELEEAEEKLEGTVPDDDIRQSPRKRAASSLSVMSSSSSKQPPRALKVLRM
ncbi:hypothetical protein D9615_002939 [Tricholomella constricta]|uniref:Uncharacterized protein n=1 Tax=Tricholomella constricta TaxID=117010 RepID=A0A8H5HFH5_9AGAR|nr:hypothetical protein D9615_002939 [Tricholomella constricta]